VPKYSRYSKKSIGVVWKKAPDVFKNVKLLKASLGLGWVNMKNVFCFRSYGTQTRAVARIWGLGKIWQLALSLQPSYILEVISEKYDLLNQDEKNKILLHELSHIPKNFSGALVPHYRGRKRNFRKLVKTLIQQYNKIK